MCCSVRYTVLFFILELLLPLPLVAQQRTAPATRVLHVGGWTLGGSLRLRFEDWDFFKAPPADSTYGYGASLLRVSLSRQFRTQDWLFELEQPSLIGLPSHAVAPAPKDNWVSAVHTVSRMRAGR